MRLSIYYLLGANFVLLAFGFLWIPSYISFKVPYPHWANIPLWITAMVGIVGCCVGVAIMGYYIMEYKPEQGDK